MAYQFKEGDKVRQLVTIQRIKSITPIEGADKIEVVEILGWHVVVEKNKHKINDLVVFFEIDSLLPMIPEFEFLAKGGKPRKSYTEGKEYIGYRLKTIRLRGQVSQGLAMPLSILEGKRYPTDKRENPTYKLNEGSDVTPLLGVVKYEAILPTCLSGVAVGLFPSFIPKTDETRIQAYPKVLERHQGIPFYMTEKVDGASMTVFLKSIEPTFPYSGELHVCSRGIDLKETIGNTYWQLARELRLEEILKDNPNYALQGEIIGDKIQGNKLKLNGHFCRFFNIYDMGNNRYLDFKEFNDFCDFYNFQTVPQLGIIENLPLTVDEAVKLAIRKSEINPDVWAEGIVLRPLKEMRDDDLGRLSFKVVNPEFLLEYGE